MDHKDFSLAFVALFGAVCIEPLWTVWLAFFPCWLRLPHRNITMLGHLIVSQWQSNISSAMDWVIKPGRWDGECLQKKRSQKQGEWICVCLDHECVCTYKYGSERACAWVRALYVDGWCTGLEGKRSRLLSLRTRQSSAERNQKESKSQHWACVCGVFVCVWNAFSCLAILKKKKKKTSQRRDVYEKEEQLLCNMRPHCPPVVFYLPHQQKTQMGCETQKVEADFVGLINATRGPLVLCTDLRTKIIVKYSFQVW